VLALVEADLQGSAPLLPLLQPLLEVPFHSGHPPPLPLAPEHPLHLHLVLLSQHLCLGRRLHLLLVLGVSGLLLSHPLQQASHLGHPVLVLPLPLVRPLAAAAVVPSHLVPQGRRQHSVRLALVLEDLPSAPLEDLHLRLRLVPVLPLLLSAVLAAVMVEVGLGGVGGKRQRETAAPPPARWSRLSGRFRRKNDSAVSQKKIILCCEVNLLRWTFWQGPRTYVRLCGVAGGVQ